MQKEICCIFRRNSSCRIFPWNELVLATFMDVVEALNLCNYSMYCYPVFDSDQLFDSDDRHRLASQLYPFGKILAIKICPTGALKLNDCPVEKFIPIWLIVAGSLVLFLQVKNILRLICCPDIDESGELTVRKGCLDCLIPIFLLGWTVAGKFQQIKYNY